ncbi:MAG: PAS domain S-box protein [Magnetococcales bacterium]|nr:PAS domain S-box protein [Magnetococcales bacterium]
MLKRIRLTWKALLATVLVATATWSVLDLLQTDHLRAIFQTRLSAVLGEKAAANRILFDNHIRAYHQSVRLLAAQKSFLDHIADWSSASPPTTAPIHHERPPAWLPRASVLRGFTPLPILLLLDHAGVVRELYQGQIAPPPRVLMEPTPLLMELSHNQTFITAIAGTPYLITAETVVDGRGEPKATLMLAAPLNDEFLSRYQGPVGRYTGLVALLEGENQTIIATNQPDTLRSGVPLAATSEKFLVSGHSFFDYGSSDLLLQLVTLESTETLESLLRSILSTERHQRFITAGALIISCLLIMVWITRNIEQITRDIVDFSRNVLDSKTSPVPEQLDELQTLRTRFEQLTKEIIGTRDTLKMELEERKRIESVIRKLSRAVEQSPAAVMITDSTGRIEYVNPQFTVLTGYAADESLGRDPGFLKSGKTPAPTYKNLWETILAGQVWRGELHNRRKDGTTYWELNAISTIHDREQGTTHYVAIKEDVSLRIEMEKALEQARAAAEAAIQVKNDFMANISHELRTPLNTIIGCTNLVLEKTCGELNKTQRKYLKEVLTGADRLTVMIDDLLDISQVDTKQFILEKQMFELRGLVEGAAAMVASEAMAKNLEFTCQIHPRTPVRLRGDPVRLRHALLHLLGNAIKFTPHGKVTLLVEPAPPPADPGTIIITIADTGIGIPEELHTAIFDPFTQADSSMSRPYGGSGLGLAITKRIIELMGGSIRMMSQVNEGSVFIISIPLELPRQDLPYHQSVEPDASPACALPGRKALVAGKHPVNRLILKKLLLARGMEVSEASQCQVVENMAEETGAVDFDLICLDCSLSPSGGLEEIRRLRAIPGMAMAPILLFGGDDPRPLEDLANIQILPKPIRRAQVFRAINLALQIPLDGLDEGMEPAGHENGVPEAWTNGRSL